MNFAAIYKCTLIKQSILSGIRSDLLDKFVYKIVIID